MSVSVGEEPEEPEPAQPPQQQPALAAQDSVVAGEEPEGEEDEGNDAIAVDTAKSVGGDVVLHGRFTDRLTTD
jgi:hypothetical protein